MAPLCLLSLQARVEPACPSRPPGSCSLQFIKHLLIQTPVFEWGGLLEELAASLALFHTRWYCCCYSYSIQKDGTQLEKQLRPPVGLGDSWLWGALRLVEGLCCLAGEALLLIQHLLWSQLISNVCLPKNIAFPLSRRPLHEHWGNCPWCEVAGGKRCNEKS